MISSDLGKEVIKKELPLIPKLPGVYRMLNSKNEIKNQILDGKIKNNKDEALKLLTRLGKLKGLKPIK